MAPSRGPGATPSCSSPPHPGGLLEHFPQLRWGHIQDIPWRLSGVSWLSTRGPGPAARQILGCLRRGPTGPREKSHRATKLLATGQHGAKCQLSPRAEPPLFSPTYRHINLPFPHRPSSHVHKGKKGKQSCCREQNRASLRITLKSVLTRGCQCPSRPSLSYS